MKKLWAKIALITAFATIISGCTLVDDEPKLPQIVPETTVAAAPPAYPSAPAATDTNLVITLLLGNNMAVTTRNLNCVGSQAVAPTSIPNGDAACALIASKSDLFTAELVPSDDKKCLDTGNQILADVFGESKGKHVRVSFQRNNLCNAKVWDRVAPIVGID